MSRIIIAIDPGAKGGIAVFSQNSVNPVFCDPMPDTEGDIIDYLRSNGTFNAQETRIVLEDIVKFAGTNMPGSAMATYAGNWGFIKGAAMTLGYRVELTKPQAWQKALGLGTRSKGQSKTVWKNKLKSEAQRLYPQCKVTLQTADALLILESARRVTK